MKLKGLVCVKRHKHGVARQELGEEGRKEEAGRRLWQHGMAGQGSCPKCAISALGLILCVCIDRLCLTHPVFRKLVLACMPAWQAWQ